MKQQLAHVPRVDKAPWVTRFGKESHSWNVDDEDDEGAGDGSGTGHPGRGLIAGALRIFADCWGDFHEETAARIFNLPIELVRDAAADLDPPFEQDPEDVAASDLGDCVQALAGTRTQWGMMTVAEAARLLNQHPVRIIEAVAEHCWMFLSGDRADFEKLWIEHEGE